MSVTSSRALESGRCSNNHSSISALLHSRIDYALSLWFLDVLLMGALFVVLSMVRHHGNYYPYAIEAVAISMIAFVICTFVIEGYDNRRKKRDWAYAVEHLLASAVALLGTAILIYGFAAYGSEVAAKPSRGILVSAFVLQGVLSLFVRKTLDPILLTHSSSKQLLVVGKGEHVESFKRLCRQHEEHRKLAFVELHQPEYDHIPRKGILGENWVLSEEEAVSKIKENPSSFDGIVLIDNPNEISTRFIQCLTNAHLHQMRVYTLDSFCETFWRKTPVSSVDPQWVFSGNFELSRDSGYRKIKRACDIIFSLTLLVLFSPILTLISLLILLEGKGNVFFRQHRVGQGGEVFNALKFRTMKLGSEKQGMYTEKCDPRMTWLGKILRPLRLDEFPQLFNVIKGEMSLIGPRAEWDACAELYTKEIPNYQLRHIVKPGLTGWAQVNYPYGAGVADAMEKLSYDLYYIRHYSLFLDAQIILKTIYTMVSGGGR